MSVYEFKSTLMVILGNDVLVTVVSIGKERSITVPHQHLKVVVAIQQKCKLMKTVVKDRELVQGKFVPLLVLHCCDIPENTDMSAARHGVRCIVIGEDIISCDMAGKRSARSTKMIRSNFLEFFKNNRGAFRMEKK